MVSRFAALSFANPWWSKIDGLLLALPGSHAKWTRATSRLTNRIPFISLRCGLASRSKPHQANELKISEMGPPFRSRLTRCYDVLNIFAEKFGEKIGVFGSKQS
jgi:hypothetical protein